MADCLPSAKSAVKTGLLKNSTIGEMCYMLSSFCNNCIAAHAASALVCGLSGCGWFANFSCISPFCHLTMIS